MRRWLKTYIQDAERGGDLELTNLFRRAHAESRKGGEVGMEFLCKRFAL